MAPGPSAEEAQDDVSLATRLARLEQGLAKFGELIRQIREWGA